MQLTELLKAKFQHINDHKVYWFISNSDITLSSEHFLNNRPTEKSACFNTTLKHIQQACPAYIYIGVSKQTSQDAPELSKEEALEWLKLAQNNGALPEYVEVEECVGDTFYHMKLNLLEIHNHQEFYVYASILRYLREDPAVVKTVLLATKESIDFFVALQIGINFFVDWTSHSILESYYSYLTDATIEKEFNCNKALALKQLVLNKFYTTPTKGIYRTTDNWEIFSTIASKANTLSDYKTTVIDLLKDTSELTTYMEVSCND